MFQTLLDKEENFLTELEHDYNTPLENKQDSMTVLKIFLMVTFRLTNFPLDVWKKSFKENLSTKWHYTHQGTYSDGRTSSMSLLRYNFCH